MSWSALLVAELGLNDLIKRDFAWNEDRNRPLEVFEAGKFTRLVGISCLLFSLSFLCV